MIYQTSMNKYKRFLLIGFLLMVTACNRATQIVTTDTANTVFPTNNIATPTKISLQTPTPSIRTFVPGDPTATPLGVDITDSNFIEGVSVYKAGNYEEAIRLMSIVIQSNPNLAPPYRYRGLSYWFINDCNSALSDFERAVSINPDYAAAWAGHGLASECFGNWDQVLGDYQKALAIDPSLAFVHHNLGVYYYRQGNYEKSLEEFGLSVAIDPGRSGGWSGKAESLSRLGQYPECIIDATKAIEINPKEWLAYTDRGYCENAIGDHMKAIDDYKAYLDHDATDPIILYNLGISQYSAGLFQESIISYSQALELNPTNGQLYINRGQGYIKLEKYKEALADYNEALKFGDDPFAYSGRGDVYFGLKEYDLAITNYDKAISLMPNNAYSYCMLALTYYEVNRYQDALDAAKTSHEIDPSCDGQRLLEIQARSYYALGDNEQAILYINKALQMGEYPLGYYYRGIMFQAAGRYEEAVSDLKYFLVLTKDEALLKKEVSDANARLAELTP